MAERFAAAGGEDVREDGHFGVRTTAALPTLPEAPKAVYTDSSYELEVDMYQRITVLYSPEKRDSTKTYLSFNQ